MGKYKIVYPIYDTKKPLPLFVRWIYLCTQQLWRVQLLPSSALPLYERFQEVNEKKGISFFMAF
jgi:hypothetical protein